MTGITRAQKQPQSELDKVTSINTERTELANKDIYGYLYCHMSRNGEWTAFALSRDGKQWHDLNNGNEVYDTHSMSQIEHGARDAYITRAADGKSFVMTTTDMCVRMSHKWDNYGINLLRSNDLIHWEGVTFDFRKGDSIFCDKESPSPYKDWSKVRRVWAPQVIWDPEYRWQDDTRGAYFIYYSLLNDDEDHYDRMYYSYADRSFTRLTKPHLLFDWGYATIDADINYIPADHMYHMLIKKEGGHPGIFTTKSKHLTGPWQQPDENDYVSFEGKRKCEGSSAFRIAGEDGWRVGYVEYSTRPARYRICRADKYLSHFNSPEDIKGVNAPQHGSFIALTKEEYEKLENYWKERENADTGKVFIYSPGEHEGLRIACDTTNCSFTDIGQLCSSDYSQWGSEKRMIDPFVQHATDGTWRAVWSVNATAPAFAATYSSDLITWRPQDYPYMGEHGISTPIIEENGDKTFSVLYKTQKGTHKAIADNEFRHFTKVDGIFSEPTTMTRHDTVNVDGKPFSGQVFMLSKAKIKQIINEFAVRCANDVISRETMRDDAKRFVKLKEPVNATLHVDNSSVKPISDKLIGVFFEDISHAADGGLYAELLQNGDFEYTTADHKGWTSTTAWQTAKPLHIATDNALSDNNPHYAIITDDKIYNEGWNGIADTGAVYNFSIYARNISGKKKNIIIALVDENDNIKGKGIITVNSGKWKKYVLKLKTKKGSSTQNRLMILGEGKSEVAIDIASLFPNETFKGHGLRKDLAEAIAAIHPRFVRFPGGCMSHGQGIDNIYHWNETVGPLKDRKPTMNIWHYHQSRGLGFYEYFQFCEDIGAEPLPVLAAGVPCQNSAANTDGYGGQQGGIPMADMPAYIDEILNMIEWANGDPKTSKWAKMRADAGHPTPFNLKMIGIGNEDLISTAFEERYLMICKAIRNKYPDIVICGTVGPFHAPSSDYIEGWKIAKTNQDVIDMVDEHYYESTGWFLHNQDYYDHYDRNAPKVYLGEYASRTRTLESALAEAIHLCNIERNGDVVAMTSYAPLLCNENAPNWNPDMIYFDNRGITSLTPSYYTQKLFSTYSGNHYIKSTITIDSALKCRVAASVVCSTKTGRKYLKIVNALPVELRLTLDGISMPEGTRSESFKGRPTDESIKIEETNEQGDTIVLQPYSLKVIFTPKQAQ